MNRLIVRYTTILFFLIIVGSQVSAQYQQMFQSAQQWGGGQPMSGSFAVEQQQWPVGYGVRIYAHNNTGTANVNVSVEGHSLLIRSEMKQQQTFGRGSMTMSMGSSSQRLSFPPDADMQQIKITNYKGLIDIFIPRRR